MSKDNSLEIKVLIFRYLNSWFYIALLCLVALTGAYFANKYAPTTYSIKSSFLVKSEDGQATPTNLIFDNSIFNQENLANQLLIVQSTPLVMKAIENLGLRIEVSRKSRNLGVLTPLYKRSPLKINVIGELLPEGFPNLFTITDFNKTGFLLSMGDDEIGRFGWKEKIDFEELSFSIEKSISDLEDPAFDYEYELYFHNIYLLTERYKEMLKCSIQDKEASIIELQIFTVVSQREVEFLGELIRVFDEANLESKNEGAVNTIKFLDNELLKIKDSLFRIETRLVLFKNQENVVDISKEGEKRLDLYIELDKEKSLAEGKLRYAKYLNEFVNDVNPDELIIAPTAYGIDDLLLNNLTSNIIELQIQRKTLIESKVTQTRALSNIDLRINSLLNNLKFNLNEVKSRSETELESIEQRMAELQVSLSKLPEAEIKLLNIQRLYDLNQNLYTLLLEKKSEVEITRTGTFSDFRVIEPPRVDGYRPVGPKKKRNYLIALLIGLVLPLVVIVVNDYLDTKIKTREDLGEFASHPFLGYIIETKNPPEYFSKEYGKNQFVETVRTVWQNAKFILKERNKGALMITSTTSGEGKTFIAANIGRLVSEKDRIIIIDADMRRSRLHKELSMTNKEGLSTLLFESLDKLDDIIESTESKNLDIITAGPTPPNPIGLLESENFEKLIETLKKRYDYVLVDTPPLAAVSDAIVVSEKMDACLLLLRSNYTKKEALELTQELYDKNIDNKWAVIINALNSRQSHKYYGGYNSGYFPNESTLERSGLLRFFRGKKK